MARIVLLGAGVVGLGTAMLLADDGHEVVVLERDAARPAASPDDAWASWERRGVNQFRLPHFFLARFRSILDEELPRVAKSIESEGALRMNPLLDVPETIRGPERADDAACEVLTGRRPTVELGVSLAADATPGLEVRRGVAVTGVVLGPSAAGGHPHVVGVTTESGEEVRGDLVVDMLGRRSPLPTWLAAAGVPTPDEALEDSGFMYYGRHFRSADGSLPFSFGGGLQHLGTISMLTLPADNGTWGVAIVTVAKDKALLGLRDLSRWEATMRALPLHAHWIEGEPLDERVVTMSKIEDRIRTYTRDGSPLATGLVSVGDAWACSNPSLGRGASIGMLHGRVLRDRLRDVGLDDHASFATAFHASTASEVLPWYAWTLATDRHRLAQVEAQIAGAPYVPGDADFEFDQALASAGTKDPDLLRLMIRGALVLERPDPGTLPDATVQKVHELGGTWRDDPVAAPSREELVALANG